MTNSETNLDVSTDLTPQQQTAIIALLESKTIEAAADKAGVSSRTISRWLNDGVFLAELHSIQNSIWQETSVRLLGLQAGALDKLEKLMNDSKSERIQLSAASQIMDFILRWYELSRISARLTELEELLENGDNRF